MVMSVKPSSELRESRVREKLEIERRYWTTRGAQWSIMTENEINRTKAANIEWLAQAKDLMVFGLSEATQDACCRYFLELYQDAHSSLADLFKDVEGVFGLSDGMGMNIYKYLAYWKRIVFNAEKRLDLAEFYFSPNLSHVGGEK